METLQQFTFRVPSISQLIAARAYLRWSQQELAEHAGVGIASIKRMEGVGSEEELMRMFRLQTLSQILGAFETAGVRFGREGAAEVLFFDTQAQRASSPASHSGEDDGNPKDTTQL